MKVTYVCGTYLLVSILWLADAAVAQRVAAVIRRRAEVLLV